MRYGLNLTNVTDRQYWTSSLGNRQLHPGQPFTVMADVRVPSGRIEGFDA